MENNTFRVTLQKEEADIEILLNKIKEKGWIDSSTILVNCFPPYSSRLTQTLNHRLSFLNKNELFEVVNLEMPYPNTNQVWSEKEKQYVTFDNYLKTWVEDVYPAKFLFVEGGTQPIRNINKVFLSVRQQFDIQFVIPYIHYNSSFVPNYFVENYNGRLLYQWENINNKNLNNNNE